MKIYRIALNELRRLIKEQKGKITIDQINKTIANLSYKSRELLAKELYETYSIEDYRDNEDEINRLTDKYGSLRIRTAKDKGPANDKAVSIIMGQIKNIGEEFGIYITSEMYELFNVEDDLEHEYEEDNN